MSIHQRGKEEKVELLWQRVKPLGLSRRRFLALLGAGGTAAVLAACDGQGEPEGTSEPSGQETPGQPESTATATPAAAAGPAKPVPEAFFIPYGTNYEMRWERMADQSYVTDSSLFFIRNHAETPILNVDDWRLRVTGNGVENPLELSYDDLLQMPSATVTRYIECAGNGRGFYDLFLQNPGQGTQWKFGAFGIGTWTGVPLAEILDRAGVKQSAVSLMGIGLDSPGVAKPMTLDKARQEDTLVVYGMNGGPLPYDHGFPARLLVPGFVGIYNVKWLGTIEVAEEQQYTRWNTTSYILKGPDYQDPEGPPEGEHFEFQSVKSAIALPWPATLRSGEQRIVGFAWSPFAPIATVEVSTDGGQTFQAAELVGPNLAAAGTRWELTVNLQAGETTLMTRATDQEGNSQWSVEEQKWNEQGYIWGAMVPHPVTVQG